MKTMVTLVIRVNEKLSHLIHIHCSLTLVMAISCLGPSRQPWQTQILSVGPTNPAHIHRL